MLSMLRRDGRLALRDLLPALLLTLLFAALCAGVAGASLKDAAAGKAPVELALVDEENSFLSRTAIKMVRQQPFIAALFHFEDVSEEEAREGIDAGRYAAAILLPKGFTSDITTGQNGRGTLLLSEAAAEAGDLLGAVALLGERLLACGQYGVFAGQALIWSHGFSDEFHMSFLVKSNTALLDLALDLYETGIRPEALPYRDTELGTLSWYLLCFLTFLLLFSGCFFSRLSRRDCHRAIAARLQALGVGPGAFLAGKVLWPFLFRLVLTAGLLLSLQKPLGLELRPLGLPFALFALLLLSVFTAAVSLLTAEKGGAPAILFALAFLGLLLNGGLLPRAMLPEPMLFLGSLTPSGAYASLLGPLLGDSFRLLPFLAALVWTGLLLLWVLRFLKRLPTKGGTEA